MMILFELRMIGLYMWIMMSHVLKIKKSIFVYWEIVSVFLYQFSWFSWIHVHVWPVNEMQYNCPPPLLQSHAHQSPPVLYRQPFHCSISGLISSLCQQHLEKLARIGFQKNFVYLIKQILCNFYQPVPIFIRLGHRASGFWCSLLTRRKLPMLYA